MRHQASIITIIYGIRREVAHLWPVLLCSLALLIGACKDEPKPSHRTGKARTTTIIYMAAENSLSKDRYDGSYSERDLREMGAVASKVPDDCNVVVYLDDRNAPRLYTLTAQKGLHEFRGLSERNSADATVFGQTLKEITEEFPAEHYNLVMWSHGSGWTIQRHKTIGIDNNANSTSNTGTELNIDEMRDELLTLGIHWDCILFDACFMQCVESDYELRHVTDYIIASPAEMPGEGAPYQLIIPCFTAKSAVAESIGEAYYSYYNNEKDISKDGIVLSVVKTSELDRLLNVTRELCPDYYTKAYGLNTDDLQRYGTFSARSRWKPEFHDMGSAMYRLLSAEDYATWRTQLDRTVYTRHFTNVWFSEYATYDDPLNPGKKLINPVITDQEHVAILSVFIPNERYDEHTTLNEDIKLTEWYRDFTTAQ